MVRLWFLASYESRVSVAGIKDEIGGRRRDSGHSKQHRNLGPVMLAVYNQVFYDVGKRGFVRGAPAVLIGDDGIRLFLPDQGRPLIKLLLNRLPAVFKLPVGPQFEICVIHVRGSPVPEFL